MNKIIIDLKEKIETINNRKSVYASIESISSTIRLKIYKFSNPPKMDKKDAFISIKLLSKLYSYYAQLSPFKLKPDINMDRIVPWNKVL